MRSMSSECFSFSLLKCLSNTLPEFNDILSEADALGSCRMSPPCMRLSFPDSLDSWGKREVLRGATPWLLDDRPEHLKQVSPDH